MIPQQWQETGSLTEALEKTFNGKNPCVFCLAAEELNKFETECPEESTSSQNSMKSQLKDLAWSQSQKVSVILPRLNKVLIGDLFIAGVYFDRPPPVPPPQ